MFSQKDKHLSFLLPNIFPETFKGRCKKLYSFNLWVKQTSVIYKITIFEVPNKMKYLGCLINIFPFSNFYFDSLKSNSWCNQFFDTALLIHQNGCSSTVCFENCFHGLFYNTMHKV